MKKYLILLLLVLICCAGVARAQQSQETKPAPAPPVQKPLVIPEAQAARIRDAQQQIACLREPNCTAKQITVLELASQNALLDACIELGLSKKQLESLQLRVDEQGQLVLALKLDRQPVEKPGATTSPAQKPPAHK